MRTHDFHAFSEFVESIDSISVNVSGIASAFHKEQVLGSVQADTNQPVIIPIQRCGAVGFPRLQAREDVNQVQPGMQVNGTEYNQFRAEYGEFSYRVGMTNLALQVLPEYSVEQAIADGYLPTYTHADAWSTMPTSGNIQDVIQEMGSPQSAEEVPVRETVAWPRLDVLLTSFCEDWPQFNVGEGVIRDAFQAATEPVTEESVNCLGVKPRGTRPTPPVEAQQRLETATNEFWGDLTLISPIEISVYDREFTIDVVYEKSETTSIDVGAFDAEVKDPV